LERLAIEAAREHQLARQRIANILIAEDRFEVDRMRKLGAGSYGVVYMGRYQGQAIAVKELLIPHSAITEDTQRAVEEEAALMVQARHPNIVHCHGICVRTYAILMEYMPKGDLYHLLHSEAPLEPKLVYKIFLDISVGISFLHDRRVVHRDLKSLN